MKIAINRKKSSQKFDKVIVTNLPSFYKINLFNRINHYEKLFVFFTGNQAEIRNKNFFEGKFNFEYRTLDRCNQFEKLKIINEFLKNNFYRELIIGGWDEICLWGLAFTNSRIKNSLILESSILDSDIHGFKGNLKKLFLNRISKVYASGILQKQLAEALQFKKEIKITNGVGIFNFRKQPPYECRVEVKNYLYVGRFSEEKNLEFLIRTFDELPHLNLHLVGYGPLGDYLKKLAPKNVFFLGKVDNKDLHEYYRKFDVFILPSLSETWGLVIEEALNNGMPVLVSDRVGCVGSVVTTDYGIIYESNNNKSLINAISNMNDLQTYNYLRFNISKMSFSTIADQQVATYML